MYRLCTTAREWLAEHNSCDGGSCTWNSTGLGTGMQELVCKNWYARTGRQGLVGKAAESTFAQIYLQRSSLYDCRRISSQTLV